MRTLRKRAYAKALGLRYKVVKGKKTLYGINTIDDLYKILSIKQQPTKEER